MGKLVYFCAGADRRVVSGKNIKALLLSVPNHARNARAIGKSLDLIKSSGAEFSLLDSGGFQLLKAQKKGWEIGFDNNAPIYQPGKINLTPRHDVQAAMDLKPQSMIALDFPVRKIKERNEQETEFRKKLKFNVKWAVQTAELRERYCPQIKLFIPVQCYTLDHLDIFFRRIQGVDFDGVSMPVRNLGLKEISLFLFRFHQRGIKWVHLLGTSAFFTMALGAYMARHFFEWVSLDSTTWKVAAHLGAYLNPDLSRTWAVADGLAEDHGKLRCRCPWCRGKIFSDIKGLGAKEKFAFLCFHNLWATQQAAGDLVKYSDSLELMKSYLKRINASPKKAGEVYQCLIGLRNARVRRCLANHFEREGVMLMRE